MKNPSEFRNLTLAVFLVLFALPILSAPPDPPGNPAPSDGAADAPAATVLCVDVSDPQEKLSTSPSWHARPAWLPKRLSRSLSPRHPVLSQSFPGIFMAQTRWIVENRKALNIEFVSHLGDIVQVAAVASEWGERPRGDEPARGPGDDRTSRGHSLRALRGQPPIRARTTMPAPRWTLVKQAGSFNQYFGLPRFSTKSYYGGHNFANNDNSYQLFEASGMDFIIVHHEFDKRI